MVRMIMHGCGGAMGQVITGLAAEDDSIEIVAGGGFAPSKGNGRVLRELICIRQRTAVILYLIAWTNVT